jgi:hypothetical protein
MTSSSTPLKLLRTQAILDAGPPCRSRLKDVDAGYMLAALFFFVLIWVATG